MNCSFVDHGRLKFRLVPVGVAVLFVCALNLAPIILVPSAYGDGAVVTQASFASTALPLGVGYLNGIDCLSSVLCYVAGQTSGSNQSGLVLQYSAGTWHKSVVPSVTYLTGVSCESALICWATGVSTSSGKDVGEVVGTTDGITWTETSQPGGAGSGSGVPLGGVSCFDTFCMAVGSSSPSASGKVKSDVWVTDELGQWESVTPPEVNGAPAELVSVSCDAPEDCWVVGGGVWHSADGGESWSQLAPSETNGGSSSGEIGVATWSSLTTVHFTTSSFGEVAGGDQCGGHVTHCSGAIYRTANGGSSWKLVSDSSTPFINDLSCGPIGGGPCVATSSTFGPVMSTSQSNEVNGATILDSSTGNAWQTVQKVSGPNFPALACPSVGVCFLVGGVIAHNAGEIYVEHATSVSLSKGTGKGYCAHAYPGHGYAFGPQIADVYACGPTPLSRGDDSGPEIPEFWPTTGNGGFQCTELAIRYLYDVSGIFINIDNDSPTHWNGAGKDFASDIGSYLHVPVGQHINGQLSSKPQVGDILSESVSHDESDTDAGKDARKFGDVGVVESVSGDHIRLMVQNNNNSGINTITMYSAKHWGINGAGSGFYYENFAWFTPPSATSTVSMPTSAYKYQITGAGTVNEYSSFTRSSTVQAVLPAGNSIYVTCQRSGAEVNGSSVWDQLSNGGWISDWYATTPNFATFSYPIPVCINPKSWEFKVTATSTVQERAGPSTADASVGSLSDQDIVHVVCQTVGAKVDGDTVWDYQANRSYVPDVYASTPSGGQLDADIPQCPYVEEYIPGAT